MTSTDARPRRIVLAVTSPVSLRLMSSHPRHLQGKGWDVHVVTQPTTTSVEGATMHGIEMLREPSPLGDIRSLFAWCALLRRLRPSCVLTGTPKAGLLGISAAWLSRVPRRIYLLRGLRLETETGLRFVVLWLCEFLACRMATDTLAVSHSLRQRCLDLRLVRPSAVSVLGQGSSNGVDLGEFYPDHDGSARRAVRERFGYSLDDFIVGFVGRVHAHKGLELLAEALSHDESAPNAHLFVVGETEDLHHRSEITARLARAGVPVVFAGSLNDMRLAYCAIDVLVLPSRREGFPNVVLEAAACRVPSVVTDVTGCRDAVIDTQTGWLVPANDHTSLARVLATLNSDPEKLKVAGYAARDLVEEHFSREDVWARIDDYLDHDRRESRRSRRGVLP